MKVNRRPRRQASIVHALYINAGLLLAILVALLMRGNGLGTPALGAPQMAPVGGGGGVFLIPAQFSAYSWGCYLMDIDSQNICAYQYVPSDRQLRFVAARNYREDRKIKDWNTAPPPGEMANLNGNAAAGLRGSSPPTPDSVLPSPPSESIIVPPTQPVEPPAGDKGVTTLPGEPSRPGEEKATGVLPTRPGVATQPSDHL